LFGSFRRQVNFEAIANADACALGPDGPSGPRMWHVHPIVEVVQRSDDGFGASEWTLHVVPINFLVSRLVKVGYEHLQLLAGPRYRADRLDTMPRWPGRSLHSDLSVLRSSRRAGYSKALKTIRGHHE